MDAGLWSCWWFSPCLICGCSPRWNMDAAGNVGGGLAVWFFPIVSAGRCPVPSCKRKSLSGLIVGRAFVLSGGLIVWGCGCCTASSVGGWVSDLGCVGVCCACVRDAAGRSDRRCAGGAGRSVAGAAAGCGAADLCMISPRRGALAACIRARAGCVLRRCQSGAAMWVWDSSQQVLATQGAVYVQGHCLQEQRLYKRLPCLQVLGPLQEHTTFRESLVCYTSPPGGV